MGEQVQSGVHRQVQAISALLFPGMPPLLLLLRILCTLFACRTTQFIHSTPSSVEVLEARQCDDVKWEGALLCTSCMPGLSCSGI